MVERSEEHTNGSGGERRARHGLATALGAFSVGLGLAEMAAPRTVARLIGIDDRDDRAQRVLRGFGVRELAAGIGLLGGAHTGAWLWSRVAGDVMDLAFLGTSFTGARTSRPRLTAATAAVAAVTALDVVAGRRATTLPEGVPHSSPTHQAVVTVNRTPADAYGFWRRLANLPRFMTHVASVEETGERTSHWVVGAAGTKMEWDAEIVDDVPGERIAWRALPGASVPNEGQVAFTSAPGGRGTEVRVTMTYEPPAGRIGSAFAKLLGSDPGGRLRADLRRFKQLLETGQIPTTVGQTIGARSVLGRALEPIEEGSQS